MKARQVKLHFSPTQSETGRSSSLSKNKELPESSSSASQYRFRDKSKRIDLDTLSSSKSSSTNLSSLLRSDGSSYKLASQGSSRNTISEAEQYADDRESDMEEMRQFIREEGNRIKKTYSKFARKEDEMQENQRRLTLNFQDQDGFRVQHAVLCLGVIMAIVAVIWLSSQGAIKEQVINPVTCWQKFKLSNCDIDSPIGTICQELYRCILDRDNLEKSEKSNLDELQDSKSKEESSFQDENSNEGMGMTSIMAAGGLISLMCYIFGTREMLQMLTTLLKTILRMLINKYYELQRARRDN